MTYNKLARILALSFIVVAFLFSCRSPSEKTVDLMGGSWSIDSIIYKNYEIKNCLTTNMISFGDSTVSLPTAHKNCDSIEELNSGGVYKVIYKTKEDISMVFHTKNRFFRDTFKLMFIEDQERQVFKLAMKSNELIVWSTKGLFAYGKIEPVKEYIHVHKFNDQ